MRKNYILFATLSFAVVSVTQAQESKNLAEQLGYPKDAKLLIIHADDMGLSHSTNLACIKAFEEKGVTTGSVMVPCPWFPEIANYVKKHPGMDVGIHLTLTSEWEFYRWDGVTPSDQIPSLIDKQGYMYATNEDMAKTATPVEVEKEMRAQIDRAIAFGIQPTHIDNHMGSLLVNPEFIKVYIKLANEYHLPLLIPSAYLALMPADVVALLSPDAVKIDELFELTQPMISRKWNEPYDKFIANMKPGLNEILVHLSMDNKEMKAIAAGHDDYGSKWRKKDLDYVTSKEFKEILKKNNIFLIGWKQIRDLGRK